jgi:hypothetical protein
MTDDIEQAESPQYIPNPACVVKGNLIVNKDKSLGDIYSAAYKFSDISQNELYSLGKMDELFVDAKNGNYNIKDVEKLKAKITEFENIPYEKIGRIAE